MPGIRASLSVTFVFGDVARFVEGSVNASAFTHIGNSENSRFGVRPRSHGDSAGDINRTTV
jgi:hypothetical protein